MGNGENRATLFVLSLLCAACSLHRGPSSSLPAVTGEPNPDGTQTRQVYAGRSERPAAVERRLLSSIECANYEIVATGQSTEPQTTALYWVRYHCMGQE